MFLQINARRNKEERKNFFFFFLIKKIDMEAKVLPYIYENESRFRETVADVL
jgi:hypothetical protein